MNKAKEVSELEYNLNQMLKEIYQEREDDRQWLADSTQDAINDEHTVCQKQEASRAILISQVNFLKQRLKMEIDSRRITDKDIYDALEKYKFLIAKKIEN